ncbi:hypothetical protein ACWGLF_29030 [Streptomyces puniciscabiei]
MAGADGPVRAEEHAKPLTAIAPDCNCPWPLHWHRHSRILAADEPGGHLPDIAPGVTFDGDDAGRRLERQVQPGTGAQLSSEQPERLFELGIKPLEAPSTANEPGRPTITGVADQRTGHGMGRRMPSSTRPSSRHLNRSG